MSGEVQEALMRSIAWKLLVVADEIASGALAYHDISSRMGEVKREWARLDERTKWTGLADPDLPDWFK